ncbi:histidine phosphatase superfamily [Pyronema omphalodes]|nr:histidine phosphatase superfamily [Pyronema omphalodes]
MIKSLALLSLAAQVAYSQSTTETVHGAVIFSRHGDRTWKGAPPTKLTAVGQNQLFNSGEYWRSRYLASGSQQQISGIDSNIYEPAQFSAAAPNQALLVTSGQAFLQGLYPPTTVSETLANGSSISPPLSGFQYAALSTIPDDSPETIWLKGDDSCPAYDYSVAQVFTSTQFTDLEKSTKAFYESFYDRIFAGVLAADKMSYKNAFTIYDYINVGMVHNTTIHDAISSSELIQLRTLADSHEFALSNGEARSVSGRTLSAKILKQLSSVVDSKGSKNKLALYVGSYDTFLSFFSLSGLSSSNVNFTGLPDYASAMSFELFSNSASFPAEKDLQVRFLFRNGTENGDAQAFPIFGGANSMSWTDFKAKMSDIALATIQDWCGFCGSSEGFCLQYADTGFLTGQSNGKELKPAVAGAIGALVALNFVGVFVILGIFFGLRIVRKSAAQVVQEKQFDQASM